MPRLTIDNREVEVDDGMTVLDAAGKLGIEIPTMCFLEGYEPSTSCMVCVVKVEGRDGLVASCGLPAEEGMRVETATPEIVEARKAALELLLSDHVGDCMGPCQVACPAKMDIPLMIRQIAAGQLTDAIVTVKRDIALPAVLGRICPAPCENVCRRREYDEAVSICLLKRYVADVDLQSAQPYMPVCKAKRNKSVAIIGAGPAGLSAAYYLLQAGFDCTVFDDHDRPGGMLRYGVSKPKLPEDVLDAEIELVTKLGLKFEGGRRIETETEIEQLRSEFDAVFIAVGRLEKADAEQMGFEPGPRGIAINPRTYQTNIDGVFAGGDAVRRRKMAVRAVADGKEAAASITQYLAGEPVTGLSKAFNTRMGKLLDGEMEKLMTAVSKTARQRPSVRALGFSGEQARKESARCMHCDCRKADVCKLRLYSQEYDAKANRYKSQRREFAQQLEHPQVIYEPGKCIKCGLCVQIAAEQKEKLGLTFIGRGFDVRVAVPFNRSIADGLRQAAGKCAAVCPTGALAIRDGDGGNC